MNILQDLPPPFGAALKRKYTLHAQRPTSAQLSNADARAVGESIIQVNEWFDDRQGYVTCPGEASHTTLSLPTHCKIVVAPLPDGCAPGCYCFHDACLQQCEAISFQLRSALGRAQRGGGYTGERCTPRPAPLRPAPAVFDPEKLAKLHDRLPGITPEWLEARSEKVPWTRTQASFLRELFNPGEKVVVFDVFESQGQHLWESREYPYNARELQHFGKGKPCGVWFLNAPITGEYVEDGKHNRDGTPHVTRRSWRTVTAFRYVVLESDEASPDHWLSALVQMPLRIASIVTSGGKSVHACVRIDAATKAEFDDQVELIKPGLITLGADRKAMSAVRLTRLPACQRLGTADKDGNYIKYPEPRLQRLLYVCGNPDRTPICEKEVRA